MSKFSLFNRSPNHPDSTPRGPRQASAISAAFANASYQHGKLFQQPVQTTLRPVPAAKAPPVQRPIKVRPIPAKPKGLPFVPATSGGAGHPEPWKARERMGRLSAEINALNERARQASTAGETFKASMLQREAHAVRAELARLGAKPGVFDRLKALFSPRNKAVYAPTPHLRPIPHSFPKGFSTAPSRPSALDGLGYGPPGAPAQPAYDSQPQQKTFWGSVRNAGQDIWGAATEAARAQSIEELNRLAGKRSSGGKGALAPPAAAAPAPVVPPVLVIGGALAAGVALVYFLRK